MASAMVGSPHLDRLETTLQRGILLDVLAVLRRWWSRRWPGNRRGPAPASGCRQRTRSSPPRSPRRRSCAVSSMKRTMSPSGLDLLRYADFDALFEIAAVAGSRQPCRSEVQRESGLLASSDASGTSPAWIFSARPSATAVLPTPGSPISTGLFLVRRLKHHHHTLDFGMDRPITGSSFPAAASAVRLRPNWSRIAEPV